jgi:TolA-binding protein
MRHASTVLPLFEDAAMSTTSKRFFSSLVGRMFASEPPVVDKRMQNLEQKRANIRAAAMRERVQMMRARTEEMTQRIEAFKKQRSNETQDADAQSDPFDHIETIVLAS